MFQSLIDRLLLKDNGKGSYSLTFSVIGFIVINVKLLFSGSDVQHMLHFSDFSGIDYAAALAAITGLHLGNKAVTNHIESKTTVAEEPKDVN